MTEELKELMQQQYKSGKAVKSAQLKRAAGSDQPALSLQYAGFDQLGRRWTMARLKLLKLPKAWPDFYRISLNRGQQVVTIEQELRHVEALCQDSKSPF